MNSTTPIIIEALVESSEQPGLIVAAQQLSECLNAVSNTKSWKVRLQFHPHGADIDPSATQSVIIVSLLPETNLVAESIAETKARWRAYLGRLQAIGPPVFVRTVFRHVRERAGGSGAAQLLERIRRLNRMAVELSHELGVAVIEIDRAFAHIGGRALESDYLLMSPLAAEVSGHTTVWSLLSAGLDETIDPRLQEKAKAHLGGLNQIDALLSRRQTAGAFVSQITPNANAAINTLVRHYYVDPSITDDKVSSILLNRVRLGLVIELFIGRDRFSRFRHFIRRVRLRRWEWLGFSRQCPDGQ